MKKLLLLLLTCSISCTLNVVKADELNMELEREDYISEEGDIPKKPKELFANLKERDYDGIEEYKRFNKKRRKKQIYIPVSPIRPKKTAPKTDFKNYNPLDKLYIRGDLGYIYATKLGTDLIHNYSGPGVTYVQRNSVKGIYNKQSGFAIGLAVGRDFTENFSFDISVSSVAKSKSQELRDIEIYTNPGVLYYNGFESDYPGWYSTSFRFAELEAFSKIETSGTFYLANANFYLGKDTIRPLITGGMGMVILKEQVQYNYGNVYLVGIPGSSSRGGSVGMSEHLNSILSSVATKTQTLAAYQLGLGVAFKLNEFFSFEGKYQYFGSIGRGTMSRKRVSNNAVFGSVKVAL
jgi:opacity protein-like surface antigen